MSKRYLLTVCCTLLLFVSCMAQIVTDRPDQTESSLTVPSGAFQMESGITASFQNDSGF
jgi:hypothetical protein